MQRRAFLALAAAALPVAAQDDFTVYTEPPRLLLTRQRLRLLRRERERQSERWRHFDALIAGKAQMPEAGFAHALYYRVADSEPSGRQAIAWALAATGDARQLAIVADWCQPLLSAAESAQLQTKLAAEARRAVSGITSARDRAFAAIASQSGKDLEAVIAAWWRKDFAPALVRGDRVISSSEQYALLELMHAVRDNLQVDLRDELGPYFRELASSRVLTYYPARYPAAENDYRIPAYLGKGDPDLKVAALSRAADLSLIAFDSNSTEHQFLQGWSLHDAFQLKGTFGAPYEFLWANPYQPGLSYHHLPLRVHESRSGRLFIRSDWNEDATWAAWSDGRLQIFKEGKIQIGAAGSADKPLVIGSGAVISGKPAMQWKLRPEDPAEWFVVGLKPRATYDVEVDDEEIAEAVADRGGILALELARRDGVGVRLRERPAASPATRPVTG